MSLRDSDPSGGATQPQNIGSRVRKLRFPLFVVAGCQGSRPEFNESTAPLMANCVTLVLARSRPKLRLNAGVTISR